MKKETFSSSWGFILTAAGSAIGLGNIWRFPYLCGQYGGLSFILVYLLILLFICNPLMVSEIAIGRASKSNCVDAYEHIGKEVGLSHLKIWSFFGGWFAVAGVTLCLSFYFLVAGWVLYYFLEAVSGKLMQIEHTQLTAEFEQLTHSFSIQLSCGLIFLFVTTLIVIAGVKKGIERAGLYLMPILFMIFVMLSLRALTLDGADRGISFLLTLEPQYLGFTSNGFSFKALADTFTAALGQAFISLSLGFGVLLVYGSYFSPKENMFKAVRHIEIFDTLAAILSAVIIIPAIFSAELSVASGPGLTFISLPHVFQNLSGGHFWALTFYLLLMLATVTSTISIFEVLTNLLIDKFKLQRYSAAIVVMIIAVFCFTMVAASFSGAWNIKILGRDLFSLADWLVSTYTATIVSLTMALFVGYKAMKPIIHNIRRSAHVSSAFTRYFLVTLRYVAPVGLIILLVMAFVG
ncbi:MAG: sodium-dependent transporter [Alphaproteobacteria bacterium]|nr:sodium-dependent transporter [Alphaproteobacteria bacterium]